jgi:hypothetical protein
MTEDLDALWGKSKPVAKPTEDLDALWNAAKPREKTGKLAAVGRGVMQGGSLGFGDEVWGGLRAVGDALPGSLGGDTSGRGFWEMYRQNRDGVRRGNETAKQDQGGAYLTGEILGGVALPLPGGAALKGASLGARALRAAGQGAALGGTYGLGSSASDVTQGEIGGAALDTAIGTGLGAAGGALAEGVVAPLAKAGGKLVGKAGDALRKRAGRGIREAEEMAGARAEQEAMKELKQLDGSLGAETQKGSRMTENIRRIPGEAANATPESQAALMRDAARIARERAEQMATQAKAVGLEDVPVSMGEFLTKGSKVDKAQQARAQAKRMLDGAKQLEDDAERVLAGELSPKALNANLKKARDIAMDSPAFKSLEGTVLSENLRMLPEEVAAIEAQRAARDSAKAGLGETIAKRKADLLSGKAAGQRGKELALRYALPVVGGLAGQALGDEYGMLGRLGGAAAGWKAGGGANSMIGSLAGAGLRPGAQALYRTMTQYPAVKKGLWSAVNAAAPTESTLRLLPAMLPAATRSEATTSGLDSVLEALTRRMMSSREEDEDPFAGR